MSDVRHLLPVGAGHFEPSGVAPDRGPHDS